MEERDQLNALIHLYRGELGRMTAYRTRLDVTTNWAVGTTAAVGSLSLAASSPHFVLLAFMLVLLFLWMEARRYRVFRLVMYRVRLLETGLYMPVLGEGENQDWRVSLAESLRVPRHPLPLWQAVGIRLRRNYLMLVFIVAAAWCVKVAGVGSLPSSAALGFVPGAAVLSLVGAAVVALVALAIAAPRASEEE